MEFIEQNGGVEQIRMDGTKPLSVAKRADLVKTAVISSALGRVKFDPLLVPADADWNDKQVVIVATYLPTGEFEVNTVIKHDGVVNAALAAYYSNQQAAARALKKAEVTAAKEAEAIEKAAIAKAEKQKKDAAQVAKVTVDKAQAERDAKNYAFASTFLESAMA